MQIDLYKLFGVEEEEEFQIELKDGLIENLKYRVKDNCLEWCEKEIEVENRYYYASFGVNDVNDITKIIKLPKKKEFTDDELAIMRSIPINYKWIARDMFDEISVFVRKPEKKHGTWDNNGIFRNLELFQHLFQSIHWKDKEPVYIPDYVERM